MQFFISYTLCEKPTNFHPLLATRQKPIINFIVLATISESFKKIHPFFKPSIDDVQFFHAPSTFQWKPTNFFLGRMSTRITFVINACCIEKYECEMDWSSGIGTQPKATIGPFTLMPTCESTRLKDGVDIGTCEDFKGESSCYREQCRYCMTCRSIVKV